jgi:peptidoglycan/xylan/chitin deacetylase (PgdA/CDA1 family)
MNGVEVVIDHSEENRRFHIRGVVIIFFAVLFATSVVFATAAVSVSVLRDDVSRSKREANGSSDAYQDSRYTLVGGVLTKEFLSEEQIKAEDEIIAAEKKAEEERIAAEKKAEEEKKAAEEAAAAQKTYIPPNGAKIVYLTFDDGPSGYTAELLDVLKKYNVKATFFVTCNHAGNRNMITRAYNEGHSIGLHTCSHDYAKVYASDEAYFNDLNSISNLVVTLTGVESKLVRFPGGSSNTVSKKYSKGIMTRISKELTNRGYIYFDWNVSSGDAGGAKNTDEVVNNVTRALKGNYSIVLQHDIKQFSVKAVERIIQFGLKYGFTFKALDMTSPTAHHRINN